MKRTDFLKKIQERYPEATEDPANPEALMITTAMVGPLHQWLRDDPDTSLDYLDFLTCVDFPPTHFHVIYSMQSLDKQHRLALKVRLDRLDATLPTVSHIWTNAEWNEREVYDLFGVVFQGHPDPRRIMMPADWEGHPLRKDYLHPNLTSKPD